MLYLMMDRTLVKSLHSGDPDVIQTQGLPVPYYSGVNDLQGLIRGEQPAIIF
jgi:hypothetical protein